MPTWNKRFILRTVDISDEEQQSNCYQVYRHAEQANDITPVDNYFDSPPSAVSMQHFSAVPLQTPRQWEVQLALVPPVWVTMGVFQLRERL